MDEWLAFAILAVTATGLKLDRITIIEWDHPNNRINKSAEQSFYNIVTTVTTAPIPISIDAASCTA
jgi:hypothetical protein